MAGRVAITNAQLVAAVGFAATIALAFSRGGYYPTAWGWFALGAAGIAAVLLLRGSVSLARIEVAELTALSAFACLTAASSIWGTPARGIIEGERAAAYALTLTALLFGVRRQAVVPLLAGVWAGISVACGYGLLTRLFPERLGVLDSVAQIRLSEPLGYWNGVGVVAAMGILLAFGLAARASSRTTRALAAASLPVLSTALYFTFSRGAWLALAIGVLAAVAVDLRRLQLLVTTLALAPAALLAVAAAYRFDALNRTGVPLAETSRDGHRLSLVVAAAVALAVLVSIALGRLERRWTPSARVRRVFAAALVAVAVATLAAVFVRVGTPPTLVSRAYHGFAEPSPHVGGRVSGRLFSLSGTGRVPQWRVAWRAFEREPIVGIGAGSYETAWNELRPYPAKIRDAHSLYLETLAELGVIGLVLLIGALGMPFLTVMRARAGPMTSAAVGGYVAFLAHAGVDWDWEMPIVTVVALACAAGLFVAGRGESLVPLSGRKKAIALFWVAVLAAFSLVGLIGNRALSEADAALRAGDVSQAAERARAGLQWAPWSATGHRVLGEARLADGDLEAARESFRTAVEADPVNWELWFALAQVTSGDESARALAEARRLNPRSPELRAYLAAPSEP